MALNDELKHYGIKRRSGRYPWGSGDNPYQHNGFDVRMADQLKEEGLSEKEIAERMNMSISELRRRRSIARIETRKALTARAIDLKSQGYGASEIGRMMGINESSVRSLLDPTIKARTEVVGNTANMLREEMKTKKYLDIGPGVENQLGISRDKFETAVRMLRDEGCVVQKIQVDQLGTQPGMKTTISVLCPEGTTYADVNKHPEDIKLIGHYSEDNGRSIRNIEKPRLVDPSRIYIRYAEDGGKAKDGTIELRRGVEDLSLGSARYAQVRIGVEGNLYLKGMAFYSDDVPKGYDIIVNSNKPRGTPVDVVMKKMKHKDKNDPNSEVDWDNPFGATIKNDERLVRVQKHYIDKNGKEQLSSLNIVNEEGNWGEWKKTIASQVLSKQDPLIAKKQLNEYYNDIKKEYDEISSLTNPTIKKTLLASFADKCDSASVHLEAAAFPRQASHVILPFNSLKETEIYAPKYDQGEEVILIRYPHGGIFEIPRLKVNNNNAEAKSTIGNAIDAVGINSKVASILSGADFDGDTVLVIPTKNQRLKNAKPLEALKDFDTDIYKFPDDDKTSKRLKGQTKQNEMGRITNLITDMTIKGADMDEIARAVKHSMVVIDAEKHDLDWRASYEENGIAELKQKYQKKANGQVGGASTLISRASSETHIPTRKEGVQVVDPNTGKVKRMYIDPETGEKLYTNTGETYYKGRSLKSGEKRWKETPVTQTSTQMADAKDARELSSGQPIEEVYAAHANRLKSLANQARKDTLTIEPIKRSPQAAKTYEEEVASLNRKLNEALKNKPLERQAQIIAGNYVKSVLKDNGSEMDADDKKKLRNQALEGARFRIGAKKQAIEITDREWEAIQSGAISNTTLEKIINNTDKDALKQRAMPKQQKTYSDAVKSRAKALSNSGATLAEISRQLGIPASTVSSLIYND